MDKINGAATGFRVQIRDEVKKVVQSKKKIIAEILQDVKLSLKITIPLQIQI